MTIHYFGADETTEKHVAEKLAGHSLAFHKEALPDLPDLSDEGADTLCIFVDSPVGEAELVRFPNLKLIAACSTGFDHIDLVATKARGITVVNVPAYGENTVAEFTFALLLALARHVVEASNRVRTTGTFSPDGLRGFDLAGKTLGVLGTGRIGAHVIKMAKGFDMNVIGFDAFPNTELSAKLNFPYLSLAEVLAQADVLTLHVPYNKETHHLLNKENIGQVKKGAYLLNTSRGAVVETEALVQALKDGTLAGAGLDVLEDEDTLGTDTATALANAFLIQHPRVLVTPHTAFNTTEAVRRIVDTTISNIQNFTEGSLKNTVTS